jgi:hypothetical protein
MILIIVTTILVFGIVEKTTLFLSVGSAKFTPGTNNRNDLTIEAPYGYYVLMYNVVPDFPLDPNRPFSVGGKGIGASPIGLFETDSYSSNIYPDNGGVEKIELEEHVRISKELDFAAIAKLPEDKRILEKCGTYVCITKDRSMFDQIDDIVKSWSIEDGPWSYR